MWKNALFEEKLTVGLLKSAIQTGHIKIVRPETSDETLQLNDLVGIVNRSTATQTALTYCLLSDSIYLDWGQWNIFQSLRDEERYEDILSRPAFSFEPELRSFIHTTDSQKINFLAVYKKSRRELANLYSELEPLIWKSFRQQRYRSRASRAEVRFILDLIATEPELISLTSEKEFGPTVAKALRRAGVSGIDAATRKYLTALASITIVKGLGAVSKVAESERLNAIYPVSGTSFGKNRRNNIPSYLHLQKDEVLIGAAKVFLEEIECWPVVNDFGDVLRIRRLAPFLRFQEIFRMWIEATLVGDSAQQVRLRNEIRQANRDLEKSTLCSRVGGWFTYLGLPLAIVDLLASTFSGLPVTVAGFGLQSYADWKKRKAQWLIIGRR